MSDCGVCIGADIDGSCEFYDRSTVKSRKLHRCCECGEFIHHGQQYERVAGKWEGELFSCKTCLSCAEIRDVFSCGNAVMHESLWEDIKDHVFPQLTTATKCLHKLSVPNRTRVILKWQQWRGLSK